MQRITLAGSFWWLALPLWLAAAGVAPAQDRAGAAMAGGQAVQPAPAAPGDQPAQPPPLAGGGVVGSISMGAVAVPPPPPIGYYAPARAVDYNMGRFWYYPYYYYPHNYWPTESCPWPERPGEPYVRPPAYMAYPPFLEPHWRYEWYVPQKYYRGFHFWLDQF
jgi:hypothetical protein